MISQDDNVIVLSQSTRERELELEEMYLKVKPCLDKGDTLSKAVKKCLDISPNNNSFYNRRWYKDLKKYCIEKGEDVMGNY